MRVALAMIEMFLAKWPGLPKQLGTRAMYALLDNPLLDALGLPRPTELDRRLVSGLLRMRASAVRALPKRREPKLRTDMRRKSYPRGFRVEELGPPPSGRIPPSPVP